MEITWFDNDEHGNNGTYEGQFDCYFDTTPLSSSEALEMAARAVMSCALKGRSIARVLKALYEEHGLYFYLGVYGDHYMVSLNLPDGGVAFKRVRCDRRLLDAISWNLMLQ